MRKISLFSIGLIFFLSTIISFSVGVYFGRSQFETPVVFPDGLFVENYQVRKVSDVVAYKQEIIPSPEPEAVLGVESNLSELNQGPDLLAVVNGLRSKHGLGALNKDDLLCEKVDQRVSEQISQGKIDNHVGFERVKNELFAAGFLGVAENLAEGFASSEQVIALGWQNSTPHLGILLSTEYNLACGKLERGIAVFIAGKK